MSIREADARMRKASEAYARGRTQKAFAEYGTAARLYAGAVEPEALPRRVLALYTRALLVIKNDATGEIEDELQSGEELARGGGHPELERFRGLFAWLRGVRARLDDELATAETHLAVAQEILDRTGRPIDRLELAKERARVEADRGDLAAAAARLRETVPALVGQPALAIDAQIALAEIEEERGEHDAALKALESAGSRAFDHALKRERWNVEDRIRALKKRHPELEGQEPSA